MRVPLNVARCARRLAQSLLTCAVAGILASVLAATASAQAHRPLNVVLVMTDDQGYGDIAAHGNPHLKTPALDRLHSQSLRLTQFHVDPTCSPTRSALLTGRYSCRTGVWHTIAGRSLLRRDEVTMADVFAASGYRTGVFGKWHLGDNFPFRPQDRGFSESLIHGGGGVGQTPDLWGNDYFDDRFLKNGEAAGPFSGYCTNVFFDAALEFIERHAERPFFCYLTPNAPHGPYKVAAEYSKPYREAGLPPQVANFYGMITNFDENLDRLLTKLHDLELEDRTLLIFMTDNGSAVGHFAADMRDRKGSAYDGGHRAPCFWRLPGKFKPVDIGRLTAHVDILPTLIELCGLTLPSGVTFDGRSLLPLFLDPQGWPQRTLFVQSHRIEHPRPWRQSAVLTDRWRLVDGAELFDASADPQQKANVAADHPEVVKKLRAEYEAWYADVSQRFDEVCPIVIGAEEEPAARISGHDWHGEQVPWDQSVVREAPFVNGYWEIDVAREGDYEFTLCQQPTEAMFPVEAVSARIKVGDVEQEWKGERAPDMTGFTFRLPLKAGPARMQTWLTHADGRTRGAFYVYVRRIEE